MQLDLEFFWKDWPTLLRCARYFGFDYTYVYQIGNNSIQLGPKPNAISAEFPHYTMHWDFQFQVQINHRPKRIIPYLNPTLLNMAYKICVLQGCWKWSIRLLVVNRNVMEEVWQTIKLE